MSHPSNYPVVKGLAFGGVPDGAHLRGVLPGGSTSKSPHPRRPDVFRGPISARLSPPRVHLAHLHPNPNQPVRADAARQHNPQSRPQGARPILGSRGHTLFSSKRRQDAPGPPVSLSLEGGTATAISSVDKIQIGRWLILHAQEWPPAPTVVVAEVRTVRTQEGAGAEPGYGLSTGSVLLVCAAGLDSHSPRARGRYHFLSQMRPATENFHSSPRARRT